jgi:Stress responsive A/B Barrel Domain
MFIHIFGFRWKPEATEADKARAAQDILSFRNTIPGLIEVTVGPNLSERAQGYSFAGCMQFTSRAAFYAYVPHPAHTALLAWLLPLIDAVELDLES